jgi:muramoyltetrapeptide carboxypeptidase
MLLTATRRALITGLGALVAAPAFPRSVNASLPLSTAEASIRKPPRLKVGDAVGIVVPATPLDEAFDVSLAEEAMVAMGFKPKRLSPPAQRFGYFAGTDQQRADELNAMFADRDVKAIFALRGGWGCQRILPLLDWPVIRANPKLLVGFSDITALHLAILAKANFVTLHGPNANSAWGKRSLENFRQVAFDGAMPTYRNPVADEDRLVQRKWRTQALRGGKAQGRLIGGNLAVLTAMVGTGWLPDFSGAILFLEEIDEAPYSIDRMLTQLAQAGLLAKLSGVVFGQCTNCTASGEVSGFTVTDILEQHLVPLGIPVFRGAFFGHVAEQYVMPLGVRAEIDADAGTIRLLESAIV